MKYFCTLILVAIAPTVHAALIHDYAFHVTAGGQSATATLSYAALPAGRHFGVELVDFNFAWNGVEYDKGGVLWGELWTTDDGRLRENWNASTLGPDCRLDGGCGLGAAEHGFLFQVAAAGWIHHRNFAYGAPGLTGTVSGFFDLEYLGARWITDPVNIDFDALEAPHIGDALKNDRAVRSVPGPGALALLVVGLMALGLVRRHAD